MRCSNCGFANDPRATFCINCGNQLSLAPPNKPRSSFGKWLAIGLGVGAVGFVAICGLCLLVILVSNSSSRAPTSVDAPSSQPASDRSSSSFTFEEVVKNARQLTEIKRNDYYKSLIGKTVHWLGKVADVSDSGDVKVRITSSIGYDVVIQGVPKATYATLNLKDPVEFDGTIVDVNDVFGSGIPIITVKFKLLNRQ
jgi:hypothetical protein